MGKTFHISDILTVTTGCMLVRTEEMMMPDGTLRPAYDTNMEGLIDIIEHVSGNELRNPENPNQFDIDKLLFLGDAVKASLAEQFPWTRDLEFPKEDMPADRHEALQYLHDWVQAVAESQCSEWFNVEEDMDIGIVHNITMGAPGPGR